jgi:hypothetical protein
MGFSFLWIATRGCVSVKTQINLLVVQITRNFEPLEASQEERLDEKVLCGNFIL